MRVHRWLMALAFLALAASRPAAGTFCDLSDGGPVCGVDGIEYSTACIARVQGVEVAKEGECSAVQFLPPLPGDETFAVGEESSPAEEESPVADPGVYINRDLRKRSGKVSYKAIRALNDSGYQFVGLYREKKGFPPQKLPTAPVGVDVATPADTPLTTFSLLEVGDDRRSRGDGPRGVYLDRRGRHYVQPRRRARRAASRRTLARRPRRRMARSLLASPPGILGNDSRTHAPITEFPYTAVVALVYEVDGKAVVTCSAAFVAPSVLITTASCVYDDVGLFFYAYEHVKFYDINGRQLAAEIDTAIVSTQYTLGELEYDIALLVLDTGDVDYTAELGYLGRGETCDTPDVLVKALGYPVDKPGRKEYKSACHVSYQCDALILGHTCDLTDGMTGGPLVTPDDGLLRAIALGVLDSEQNSAVLLTDEVVAFLDEAITALDAPVVA